MEAVGDSNIVLRFLGWIDQRETDYYKAQSRAIPAVKAALEQAGFAIPEPIYRLRFDARSAPLPTEAAGLVGTQPTPRAAPGPSSPPPAPPPAPEAPADTAPDNEVAKMVAEERAEPKSGENDLLDSDRPVE